VLALAELLDELDFLLLPPHPAAVNAPATQTTTIKRGTALRI
jgi:hypothetical protein